MIKTGFLSKLLRAILGDAKLEKLMAGREAADARLGELQKIVNTDPVIEPMNSPEALAVWRSYGDIKSLVAEIDEAIARRRAAVIARNTLIGGTAAGAGIGIPLYIASRDNKGESEVKDASAVELYELVKAAKAVSEKQQKFMGMVYATKKGKKPASPEVAEAAKGMSTQQAKDYAETKHKGLPVKKEASADAYAAGFVDKCAQVGVDPEALAQYAQEGGGDDYEFDPLRGTKVTGTLGGGAGGGLGSLIGLAAGGEGTGRNRLMTTLIGALLGGGAGAGVGAATGVPIDILRYIMKPELERVGEGE